MKTLNYLRCALALFLSFCSIGSWAEARVILNENFNSISDTYVGKDIASLFPAWTMTKCDGMRNISDNTLAMKIFHGYHAKTPALGVSGTVTLSFKYARATDNYSYLEISVEGGGVINGIDTKLTPNSSKNTYTYATFTISNVTTSTRIVFTATEANSMAIDDIVVIGDIPSINLYQNSSNVATISDNLDKIVDVSTDRKLWAGVCHTMCLPFDMNRSEMNIALGESYNPLLYTYASYSNKSMSFTEIGDNGTVPAGTPFLLKVDKDFVNLKFYAVKITATTPTDVTYGSVTFKGTFNPTDLATDGTDLFLGTDNYLYIPASGTRTLGGMRAYINKPKEARLGITFNDETAAIHEVTVPAADSPIYNLQGQRITQPRTKSLYIRNGKKMIHH